VIKPYSILSLRAVALLASAVAATDFVGLACKKLTRQFLARYEESVSLPQYLHYTKKTMKNWITLLAQNAGMLKAGGGNQTADAKTLNWILMNTKDCPHCGVSVQKNQGAISGVRKSKSY